MGPLICSNQTKWACGTYRDNKPFSERNHFITFQISFLEFQYLEMILLTRYCYNEIFVAKVCDSYHLLMVDNRARVFDRLGERSARQHPQGGMT